MSEKHVLIGCKLEVVENERDVLINDICYCQNLIVKKIVEGLENKIIRLPLQTRKKELRGNKKNN